jgi:hypothetical protein
VRTSGAGLRWGGAVVVAALVAASIPSPAIASMARPIAEPKIASAAQYSSGDTRCFYGPGIELWESPSFTGRYMLLCGNQAQWPNLGGMVENFGAGCHLMCTTWNDVISSFQTFNMSHGVSVKWSLCWDGLTGTCLTYTSDVSSGDLQGWDNQISSIKDY